MEDFLCVFDDGRELFADIRIFHVRGFKMDPELGGCDAQLGDVSCVSFACCIDLLVGEAAAGVEAPESTSQRPIRLKRLTERMSIVEVPAAGSMAYIWSNVR